MSVGVTEHKSKLRDFPGCPVVRALCVHCRGCRFDPSSGN